MENQPTPYKGPLSLQAGVIQREFPYLEGRFTLVLDPQGICWINLSGVCQVLGLNVRSQQQRINRTPELAAGLRQFILSTRGGPQRINCLQVELLASWLGDLNNTQEGIKAHLLQELSQMVALFWEQSGKNPPPFVHHHQQVTEKKDAAPHLLTANQWALPLEKAPVEPTEETPSMVAATLPGLGQVLVVMNYPDGRAIREATFAKPAAWQEEPVSRRLYYIVSNEVRVRLSDPVHSLVTRDIQTTLRHLQESAVLTARYILGRWHIAREHGHLAKEGSVLIQAEELLEWRGIRPHRRVAYPGVEARQIAGYEQKHLDQVHQDVKLLELLHLQGQYRLLANDEIHVLKIDGPYLRAMHIQDLESGHAAYLIAPGGWINIWIAATKGQGGLWVAELDRRIFKLHPHNDQTALRLALFLAEHWQIHLAAGLAVMPLCMEDLLIASVIPIDWANLTQRFASRVEAALQKLVEQGIIGQAYPQQRLMKQDCWGKAWLAMTWEITPPVELVKKYEASRDRQSLPVLLPSSTLWSSEGSLPRSRQRKKRKS